MNYFLLSSALLTLLAVLVHTFIGDREARLSRPSSDADEKVRVSWIMLRGTFHWVTLDLLLLTVIQILLLFTNVIPSPAFIALCAGVYSCLTWLFWLITVLISPPVKRRFIILGQWILMFLIGGLMILASGSMG